MNIVKLRSVWYVFSGLLIVGSLFSVIVFGLKFGIDFTGGSLLSIRFDERPTSVEIERSFDGLNIGSVIVQPVGDTDVNIRMQTIDEPTHQAVVGRLRDTFTNATELSFDSIGPSIGVELRNASIKALLLGLLAIFAYIAYAFRGVNAPVKNWKYGAITMFAAAHDVIIPVGVFSILGVTLGYEVGTPFIVAILTVLGYSINDTIVVFDRIRENLHKMNGSFTEIVNASLNQTLVRSINTSFTTLLAISAVVIFGGESLRPFALALIVGIVAGTYSSIFIASPLLVTWEKLSRK